MSKRERVHFLIYTFILAIFKSGSFVSSYMKNSYGWFSSKVSSPHLFLSRLFLKCSLRNKYTWVKIYFYIHLVGNQMLRGEPDINCTAIF